MGGDADPRSDGIADTVPLSPEAASADDQRSRTVAGAGLQAGDRLGRYVVLERIGAGGMGTVYTARDPELERVVAIKLLSSDVGAGALTMRLEREARAMARLSDPNVVAVYDVGRHGGRLFIAMEYVVGGSLHERLAGGEPRWREVLALFVSAGRGLVAAHEAGIVHRDFKPANVLCDRAGRARVTDFGLARADADAEPAVVDEDGHASDSGLGPALTREGAVVGTPRYMAPEQHLRQPVTARTDQFAFCVALWEGVYGQPPFAGDSMAALASAVCGGRIAEPPAGRAPVWLKKALLRGLRSDAAERWESMAALLAALERGRKRRANVLIGVGVTAAMVATGVAAVLATGRDRAAGIDCDVAGDDIGQVWNADARARLTAAFAATRRPFAAAAAGDVSAVFDRYTAGWADMKVASCRATHERGEQSAELLDLRSQCLAARHAELQRVLALFSDAPRGEVVDRAQQLARGLPIVEDCKDVDPVRVRWRPPAAIAVEVAAMERELDRLRTLIDRGDYRAAIELGRPLAAKAAALGHAYTSGRAHLWFGEALHAGRQHTAEAMTVLQASVDAAAQAGDDRTAALAWHLMLDIAGTDLGHPERMEGIEPAARAASMRVGDPRIERKYWATLGPVRQAQGKLQASLEACGRALAIAERIDPDDVSDEHICLSHAHQELGDLGRARSLMGQALTIRESRYGADHPRTAEALHDLGMIETRRGRYKESLAFNRRALGIRERVFGPDSEDVAKTLISIGVALVETRGHDDEAKVVLERAVAIADRIGNVKLAAKARMNLANVLDWMEKSPEARAIAERGVRDTEASVGPFHPDLAAALYSLGYMLIYDDMCDRATEVFQRSAAIYRRLDPRAPRLAAPITSAAECLINAGKYAEALPLMEEAYALAKDADFSPFNWGVVNARLGQALYGSGRDKKRGVELLRLSMRLYEEADYLPARDLVKKWLRDRGERIE